MGDRDPDRRDNLAARERLTALLDDVEFVSPQQRDAIRADGNFFLMARPGSGKTRTVGVRLAWLAIDGSGRRVAATSYTNVAVEQIRATVGELRVVLDSSHFAGSPHLFTGTLLQYLHRYVHTPFAAPVLGRTGQIQL